jgi:hypothetical protein
MTLDLSFKDLAAVAEKGSGAAGSPLRIAIDRIDEDPDQPRRVFSEQELDELSATIREHGVLQPILVRRSNQEGRYVIVMGARRYRAAQRAGLREIPAFLQEGGEPATRRPKFRANSASQETGCRGSPRFKACQNFFGRGLRARQSARYMNSTRLGAPIRQRSKGFAPRARTLRTHRRVSWSGRFAPIPTVPMLRVNPLPNQCHRKGVISRRERRCGVRQARAQMHQPMICPRNLVSLHHHDLHA